MESEGIPQPDLIVVSGDLIQGAGANVYDTDIEVATQYREAGDFLKQVADEFVDSDRSRVILVPGNHDVHWGRSFAAMEPIETYPNDIALKAFQSDSRMRWNRKDRQVYTITDNVKYKSRLEQFREFRTSFYQGLSPSPVTQNEDLNLYGVSKFRTCSRRIRLLARQRLLL